MTKLEFKPGDPAVIRVHSVSNTGFGIYVVSGDGNPQSNAFQDGRCDVGDEVADVCAELCSNFERTGLAAEDVRQLASLLRAQHARPDLTELERAVVETAVKRRVVYLESTSPKVHGDAANAESAAVDALIGARKPVDPLTIAKEALGKLAKLGNGDLYGNSVGNTIAHIALLDIAALEARK